jgi:hypothetical protein
VTENHEDEPAVGGLAAAAASEMLKLAPERTVAAAGDVITVVEGTTGLEAVDVAPVPSALLAVTTKV